MTLLRSPRAHRTLGQSLGPCLPSGLSPNRPPSVSEPQLCLRSLGGTGLPFLPACLPSMKSHPVCVWAGDCYSSLLVLEHQPRTRALEMVVSKCPLWIMPLSLVS